MATKALTDTHSSRTELVSDLPPYNYHYTVLKAMIRDYCPHALNPHACYIGCVVLQYRANVIAISDAC